MAFHSAPCLSATHRVLPRACFVVPVGERVLRRPSRSRQGECQLLQGICTPCRRRPSNSPRRLSREWSPVRLFPPPHAPHPPLQDSGPLALLAVLGDAEAARADKLPSLSNHRLSSKIRIPAPIIPNSCHIFVIVTGGVGRREGRANGHSGVID